MNRLRALAARDVLDVRLDDAQVLERQAGRELADLLQRLVVGRLARLDDQVADAELLDEGHHFLLRAGADRQHRDDRGDAEDHPEHRQQRTQLVRAQVLEAEAQLGQEVRRPEMRTSVHASLFRRCRSAGSGPLDVLERRVATSGSTRAMTSPSLSPLITARLSVRFSTLTSRRSKRSPTCRKT